MKLVSFAVQNYRSITVTSKLPLRDTSTVLIGPNNEGKSNLIQALVIAMNLVAALGKTPLRHGRITLLSRFHDDAYDWERDYPVALQDAERKGESVFELEFQLDEQEMEDFRKEVGSTLNRTLPIRVSIGTGAPKFRVVKRGPGASVLSGKAEAIGRFVGTRIDFQHIPAIRTSERAESVVTGLVQRELRTLEKDRAYQDALKKIVELQKPILKAIGANVRDTLKIFLPGVRDVEVSVPEARFRGLTTCEIVVDDGQPTLLSEKGDGVQSLAALSLMRFASQASAVGRKLILAIEEPESHLHPDAIHQLRTVLTEIASQHQTILTTHCPLFVDRQVPGANILVSDNRARQASTIAEVREVLGVRTSDNLRHAELLLLVEGETDRRFLNAFLGASSNKLAAALSGNVLVVDSLLGGSKLVYRLTDARNAMCAVHCFLDNDQAGRDVLRLAENEGLIEPRDYGLVTCPGLRESELEDLFDPSLYEAHLGEKHRVNMAKPELRRLRGKWSTRMSDAFRIEGALWDDERERELKTFVCEAASSNPMAAVPEPRRGALVALVTALEQKLSPARHTAKDTATNSPFVLGTRARIRRPSADGVVGDSGRSQ